MMRWLLLLSLLAAPSAHAGEGLDVKDWLSRPGVKMLAVEFYASWCGPCKKAVPAWRRLHEKYRDQGLRLVVVSVQDPDGACINPGWNPDDVVCDAEGRLAEAWGVGDRLPAAFLWSWRGPLLVRKGHIDQVARAVKQELQRLPRVTLDEKIDGDIRQLLRAETARTGKVDVVAGHEEQEALAEIRRQANDMRFADSSTCRIGERLAPNSLLKASFVRSGNGKRLLLQLFSAETGCLNASAGVFWNKKHPELSLAEVIAELVDNLRTTAELPGGKKVRAQVKDRDISEKPEEWTPGWGERVLVEFSSKPTGAVVMLNGELVCQDNSNGCSKMLPAGSHTLEMQKQGFLSRKETIQVKEGTSVAWTLEENIAFLTVETDPPALNIDFDGKLLGASPLQSVRVSPGPHRVQIRDERYYKTGRDITLARGQNETVKLTPQLRQGALELFAQDARGNDVRADVLVDGQAAGKTPYRSKLPIGTRQLQVRNGGKFWQGSVEIQERQNTRKTVKLTLSDAPNAFRRGKLDGYTYHDEVVLVDRPYFDVLDLAEDDQLYGVNWKEGALFKANLETGGVVYIVSGLNQPQSLAIRNGKAYVAGSGTDAGRYSDAKVMEVDLASGQVRVLWKQAEYPTSLRVGEDGRLYVLQCGGWCTSYKGENRLSAVDLKTGQVRHLFSGLKDGPQSFVALDSKRFAIAMAGKSVPGETGSIVVYEEGEKATVIAKDISTPIAIDLDGYGNLYIAGSGTADGYHLGVGALPAAQGVVSRPVIPLKTGGSTRSVAVSSKGELYYWFADQVRRLVPKKSPK